MRQVDVDNRLQTAETLRQAGRIAEAIALLEPLAASPADAPAPVLHALGILFAMAKRHADAANVLARAVALDPTSPEILNNYGAVLLVTGRPHDAIAPLQRALELRREYPDARKNLSAAFVRTAVARRQQGDVDVAIALFERARQLGPIAVETLTNLGEALLVAGRADDAVESLERAIALDPAHANAHLNLGCVRMRQMRIGDAIECFEHALRLAPDLARAHMNLGMAHLQLGDFARGWPEVEWRFRLPSVLASRNIYHRLPPWRGVDDPLDGRTIFVHAEQGFGDSFQFVRYVPLIAARFPAATIIIGCRPTLRRLFERVPGVAQIVELGQPLPAGVDLQCPFMSLPLMFGTTLATIPAQVPYLAAPLELVESWRARLAPDGAATMKVGLAWSGFAGNPRDRYRSMRFADLAPLAAIAGVSFYRLQPDGDVTDPAGPKLMDHTAHLTDWSQTAALMANLDLILSVDTATAHLAGALARPTWTLLSAASEWRWLIDRTDSPWYPTMRLFRQRKLGNWADVITDVAAELRAISTP